MIEVTSAEQLEELLETNPRVIAMFTAVWCGPCHNIKPEFEHLSVEYGTVTFLSIDVDRNPELAARYRISAMPTFVSFQHGYETDHRLGAHPETLRRMVRELAATF
ncbi:thioredoxin family protein [Streptomyces sp. NPDC047453]|uniref:thioredoxin family protein n=1 Tax=Streptomyces sp. NPDC047453 TaxID=3154812 RepID=UPI0033DD33B9